MRRSMRLAAAAVVAVAVAFPLYAVPATAASPRVVVAVVDSGVDASDPALAGKVLSGWNVTAGNADAADENGHGTAVAGIIAATAVDGTGSTAACTACVILPVKVLDARGLSTPGVVARGIVWAADHAARVINVSVATLDDDGGVLGAAVACAHSRGALVVASVGNDGPKLPVFPAADAGAVAVAATDSSGNLFSWSNSGDWIAVAAPGECESVAPGGGFALFRGTSAAAPVVSAIAGNEFAAAPTATPDEVASALERSARPAAGVRYGVVDAAGAVRALLSDAAVQTSAQAPKRRAKPAQRRPRSRSMSS